MCYGCLHRNTPPVGCGQCVIDVYTGIHLMSVVASVLSMFTHVYTSCRLWPSVLWMLVNNHLIPRLQTSNLAELLLHC